MRWRFFEILSRSVLLVLGYCLCFSDGEDEQPCSQVVVQRRQDKPGFHRDLVTDLEWNISSLATNLQDCHVLVIEYLPSGIYVDLDQIKNGAQFGGPEVLSTKNINVELLAHHASSHNIFVFPETIFDPSTKSISAHISMPIHLRYHRPAAGEKFVAISLPSPGILGRCHGKDVFQTQCKITRLEAPCDAKGDSLCEWFLLNDTSKDTGWSNKPLQFTVPVGQVQHRWHITAVTVLSTLAGCCWIMWMLFKTTDKKTS